MITKEKRVLIYNRDNFTCYICKNKFKYKELTLDHIVEKSIGGSDSLGNLKTCCSNCNRDKNIEFFKIAKKCNLIKKRKWKKK